MWVNSNPGNRWWYFLFRIKKVFTNQEENEKAVEENENKFLHGEWFWLIDAKSLEGLRDFWLFWQLFYQKTDDSLHLSHNQSDNVNIIFEKFDEF